MFDWEYEPNQEDIEADDLYPRYIRRMPETMHLCGYVAVPPAHPWHGRHYDDVCCEVHGGLTYSSAAEEFDGGEVAPPGWHVFGFDCAHSGDMLPTTAERLKARRAWPPYSATWGEYRTIEYVRAQLAHLAQQAKDQAGPVAGIGVDACE